jgi:hypothetical protein
MVFSKGFAGFEIFKGELANVLKSIFDNQNIMKQELFLVRNKQMEMASSQKEKKDSEPKTSGAKLKTPPANKTTVPLPSSTETCSRPAVPSAPPQASRTVRPLSTSSPQVTSAAAPEPAQEILYIGDSISANVDIGALEVATQSQFVTAKAYSSVHDTVSNVAKQAAKFPASNFTDVIPAQLK